MSGPLTRSTVYAPSGVVATSHPLATSAGLAVLREGGTCVDAAIAVSAVLCVVEPSASHLGGDGFAVHFDGKTGAVTACNGSGVAPRGGPEQADHEERGARAATVPGLARLWQTLAERHSGRPFANLLTQAIEYAADGCPVGRRWASSAQVLADLLRANPAASEQFLVDGQPPKEGATVRQPDLAATLRVLADDGPEAFYEGPLAQKLVAALHREGSRISEQDMASHRTEILKPLTVEYSGHVIHGQPPVSQGVILLEELGLLRGFDIGALEPGSPELIHLQVEAKKIAFADRQAHLGDPPAIPVERLLEESFLAARRREIRPDRTLPPEPPPGEAGRDTTYFCVADADGSAISFIQSVFFPWGCGIVAEGTGVLMNNRMNGFDRAPGRPNSYAPGKRPVHTLNAYLATRDGAFAFAGGTPGGNAQVQTNLQVIQHLTDFGMDPQEAIERPRWVHRAEGYLDSGGFTLDMESRFPREVTEALERLGHPVRRIGEWSHPSAVQVIARHGDGYAAGSDPRAEGEARGW